MSVINKIELLGFSIVTDAVVELLEMATIIALTDEIVDRTIAIRRKYKIKLPDAIIAATAIEQGLILITRNVTDFKRISGLKTVDPWNM